MRLRVGAIRQFLGGGCVEPHESTKGSTCTLAQLGCIRRYPPSPGPPPPHNLQAARPPIQCRGGGGGDRHRPTEGKFPGTVVSESHTRAILLWAGGGGGRVPTRKTLFRGGGGEAGAWGLAWDGGRRGAATFAEEVGRCGLCHGTGRCPEGMGPAADGLWKSRPF